MFTGIVEETGEVTQIKETGEGKRITVGAEEVVEDVSKGESISVSGACLTVENYSEHKLVFFLAEETLEKTWFSRLEEGDEVNLERSLKPNDRMGGHQVQGHIEAVGEVLDIEELEEGWNMTFELPEKISSYVIEKGFVAVEGISLTTTQVDEGAFSVTIIPETWSVTNFSEKNEGDKVNLETDPTGRYVEKMLESRFDN